MAEGDKIRLDQRQVTLQVCVFAVGIQQCKPQLIFHHAETGKVIKLKKRKENHSGVEVLFKSSLLVAFFGSFALASE